MNWIELFGYLGTCVVASSFLLKSHFKFRVINAIGGLLCVIYGVIINAYPVVTLNGFILCANLYFLAQYYKQKEYFRLVPFARDDTLLIEFLLFYKDDIKLYFPHLKLPANDDVKCFYILRNMVPAGVLILRQDTDGSAEVLLDYVTKEYRDTKIGKYLFWQNAQYFADIGVQRFYINEPNKNTQKYLDKIGFKKNNDTEYELTIHNS